MNWRPSKLEAANEKLTDAFEQVNDTEGAEQFQQVLDEDAELIDTVLSRISELKGMKKELKRTRKNLEAQGRNSQTTQLQGTPLNNN